MINYEPPEQKEVNVGDRVKEGLECRPMTTLMYPLGPDDDFPGEFCAIRQGSGEHQFYTPAGESASWALLRAGFENARLRGLAHDLLQPIMAEGFDCYGCVHEDCNGMQYTDRCKLLDRARELGVEV